MQVSSDKKTISLAGGTLGPKETCSFSVGVAPTNPTGVGAFTNQATVSSNALAVMATATLTVKAPLPPEVTVSFDPASVPLLGSSQMTLRVESDTKNFVSYTETLPAGLAFTVPHQSNTVCSAPYLSIPSAGNTFSVNRAEVGWQKRCEIKVSVTGTAPGVQTNPLTVTSLASPVTASGSLTVEAAPAAPKVTMSFSPASVHLGGYSDLKFTITPSSLATVTAISFADSLPAGLWVRSNVANAACGGVTLQVLSDQKTFSLTGATLGPKQTCSFTVPVSAGMTSSAIGVQSNQVTVNSNAPPVLATAMLTVTPPRPPRVTLGFSPDTIFLHRNSKMTLDIESDTINYINFTDTLPAGLIIATPSQQTGNCSGFVNGGSGENRISVSDSEITFQKRCEITIQVTGTAPGVQTNQVTVNSFAPSVTASASLTVKAPPPTGASLTMLFVPDNIPLNGTSRLSLHINSSGQAFLSSDLTNISFNDTLPAGILVATPHNLTGGCGGYGHPDAPEGGSTISMQGGRLPPESSCTVYVDVVGTAPGALTNQATLNFGSSTGTASASLTVAPGVPPAQALPTNAPADTATLPDEPDTSGDATPGVFLDKCFCQDAPRLKDRQQKLEAIKTLIVNKLQSTPANAPAQQQSWAALQSQINGYLQVMQMQGLTTFPDTTLFDGNADPFCGTQTISAGACLDQDYAQHQRVHDPSCRAGNWKWQNQWTDTSMLQEEVVGLQLEINAIKETLKHLGCGERKPACPQFIVVVQNVTTTAINVPGMTERSGRSLNNGQGITVPLAFQDDGSFSGMGSGVDAGSAAGTTPNESVRSQFGHTQDIAASGTVQPGSCTTEPCQPDVMHLVLVGGPSEQMTQAQARGALNRNLQAATPTGGARLEFDLPAYIGGSAQKTFFSTPILSSGMTVNLLQADNGTPELPEGSSLLESLQECRATTPMSARVEVKVNETIHEIDTVPLSSPPASTTSHVAINVNESVQLKDGMPASGNMPHQIAIIKETVSVTDTPQP